MDPQQDNLRMTRSPVIPVLTWAGIQRAITGSSTKNFEDDDEIGLEDRELIRHSSIVSLPSFQYCLGLESKEQQLDPRQETSRTTTR